MDIRDKQSKLTGEVIASFVSFLRWITMQFSVLLSFWKSGITSFMSDIANSWKIQPNIQLHTMNSFFLVSNATIYYITICSMGGTMTFYARVAWKSRRLWICATRYGQMCWPCVHNERRNQDLSYKASQTTKWLELCTFEIRVIFQMCAKMSLLSVAACEMQQVYDFNFTDNNVGTMQDSWSLLVSNVGLHIL